MAGPDLVERALDGDLRAIGRLASAIERDGPAGRQAIERLYPKTGDAHVVGMTGPPGAGKSTLVNRLIRAYRERGNRVAVVAVDPSSPYSGGATLGDRIRMLDFHDDPGVFVRSMAARGHYGGLATATAGLIHLFDAAGYDPILVETVGAGQGEADVAALAHTTIVVQSPGTGDDIQAIKAGILETASIFVVNKCDLTGATTLQRQLLTMLTEVADLDEPLAGWLPPVLLTNASEGEGVNALLDVVVTHRDALTADGQWDAVNVRRARAEVRTRLQTSLLRALDATLSSATTSQLIQAAQRELPPHIAASDILKSMELVRGT